MCSANPPSLPSFSSVPLSVISGHVEQLIPILNISDCIAMTTRSYLPAPAVKQSPNHSSTGQGLQAVVEASPSSSAMVKVESHCNW